MMSPDHGGPGTPAGELEDLPGGLMCAREAARRGPARPDGLPEPLARLERTAIMGICNVTPDSFSDGGRWSEPGAAIGHGLELVRHGADLVDVGGESTRPGAGRVSEREEMGRVVPVVAGLAEHGVVVSVDTMRASVAVRAVREGAVIVNDVSGGLGDPGMFEAVAGLGVIYVLSHWRGHSAVMDGLDTYADVVRDVRGELSERLMLARAAGIDPARIVIDPGLGFAKSGVNNWPLLTRIGELADLGHPVLVGASRKRFLAAALGEEPRSATRPFEQLDAATAAVTALVAAAGVWAVRVHEPRANADAARIANSWRAVTEYLG